MNKKCKSRLFLLWVPVVCALLFLSACEEETDSTTSREKPASYVPSSPVEFVEEEPITIQ
ncbi:hypothetical protein MM326_10785 [Alkalihalobacillus sp. LMS6]|uniref:hypothetical protein n=1 Tax=Bacillaceae TaxID=186817 RepID=UPI000C07BAA5|nr:MULTISPECIES: hypothetical protein [Bacillaceae]UTR04630.1 hypothetical protein MM326_10785 [Alkalihalobacillus sp. LMS6]